MGMGYSYHHAGRGSLVSNGKSLVVSPFNDPEEGRCYFLSDYAVTDLVHTLRAGELEEIAFTVRAMGKIQHLYGSEARALLDPLRDLTLEEIIHAAQVRMERRSSS